MSEWMTLGELKPGTPFETGDGQRGVKSDQAGGTGYTIQGWVGLADGVHSYANDTMRVRPLPPPGESGPSPLTEQERAELVAGSLNVLRAAVVRMQDILGHGTAPGRLQETLGSLWVKVLNRLLWLLDQPRELIGFINAITGDPAEPINYMALADWLKEQGREADGAAMAEGWRERLVSLVHRYGTQLWWEGLYHQKADGFKENEHQARAGAAMAEIRKLLGLPEEDA